MAVMESKPMDRLTARIRGTKARNSSKLAQKQDIRPNTVISTGIMISSFPRVARTTLASPALIAPVPSMMANMPPMIRRKAMM